MLAYGQAQSSRNLHKPIILKLTGYAVYQRIGYRAERVMTYHGADNTNAKGMAESFTRSLNRINCLPGYQAFSEAIYE
jgi:hypothetical protein